MTTPTTTPSRVEKDQDGDKNSTAPSSSLSSSSSQPSSSPSSRPSPKQQPLRWSPLSLLSFGTSEDKSTDVGDDGESDSDSFFDRNVYDDDEGAGVVGGTASTWLSSVFRHRRRPRPPPRITDDVDPGVVAPESRRNDRDEHHQALEVTTPPSSSSRGGSSNVTSAVFNFANAIVGAGAIGLGGAFAQSGGLISILCLVGFAYLTKESLDLLVRLSIDHGVGGGYEEIGCLSYGMRGKNAVILSKALYSFGCLVAYVVVVRDNFGSGLGHLLYGGGADDDTSGGNGGDGKLDGDDSASEAADMSHFERFLLERQDLLAFILSATIMLPLCLLRDMTPLAKFSILSVLSIVIICVIVVTAAFWLSSSDQQLINGNDGGSDGGDDGEEIRPMGEENDGTAYYEHWFEIRPGLVESLGTFVFTFVSQHTVHLAYESLHPSLRSLATWKIVSYRSIVLATTVSLTIGISVYVSFWQDTQSDVFELYPPDWKSIDVAKLLLCVTMMLTFPLPFLTCREMVVVACTDVWTHRRRRRRRRLHPHADDDEEEVEFGDDANLRKSLLEEEFHDDLHHADDASRANFFADIVGGDDGSSSLAARSSPPWLIRGDEVGENGDDGGGCRQLKRPYHVAVTVVLWFVATALAVAAPSLGDVLDLVGCATGTVLAFVLPALFAFKLEGYTHLSAVLMVFGGAVGTVGTCFSLAKLLSDS